MHLRESVVDYYDTAWIIIANLSPESKTESLIIIIKIIIGFVLIVLRDTLQV